MTSVPDKIRSNIISHTVDVHRYEAGLRKKILQMIDQLGEDLVSQLVGAGLDTPRTAWKQARLQALLRDAGQTIGKAYEGIEATISDEMKGLVQITSKGITTACNDAFGAALMVPVKWTPELLAKIAGDTLIQGAPSAEWWARQGDGLSQAFADQMRQGMLRGETVTQLRDRIMGQSLPGVNAVGKIDLRKVQPQLRAPIWAARRNAETLVRTSVISTANAAHMEAFQANADIMDGVQWCSTLDTRTCPSCGALDGREWGWSEVHPVPSLHWGCRCSILPKTKSWEALARGAHGNSTLAKQLDKMSPANRASMGGPVSGKLTYEDWFNQQGEARQLEILGPGKLDLYQKGKLGFTDMLNQSGNPLSLKELRDSLGLTKESAVYGPGWSMDEARNHALDAFGSSGAKSLENLGTRIRRKGGSPFNDVDPLSLGSIQRYTTESDSGQNLYREINQMLRGDEPLGWRPKAQLEYYRDAMLEGFDQLPDSPAKILFRGEPNLGGWTENLLPGSKHKWNQFLSTSDLVDKAHRKEVIFQIIRKEGGFKGLSLEKISSLPSEGEVLMPPGMRFEVISREERNGRIFLIVEEL